MLVRRQATRHRWRASAASASPEQTVGAPQRCHCPCATAKSASRDCRQTWYGSRLWVCSGTRKESSRPSPFLIQYPEDRTQPRRCYRAIDTHSRQSEDPGRTARPPHRPRRRSARVLVTRGPGSSRTSRHGLSPVGLWSRAAPSARLDDRRGSRRAGIEPGAAPRQAARVWTGLCSSSWLPRTTGQRTEQRLGRFQDQSNRPDAASVGSTPVAYAPHRCPTDSGDVGPAQPQERGDAVRRLHSVIR